MRLGEGEIGICHIVIICLANTIGTRGPKSSAGTQSVKDKLKIFQSRCLSKTGLPLIASTLKSQKGCIRSFWGESNRIFRDL